MWNVAITGIPQIQGNRLGDGRIVFYNQNSICSHIESPHLYFNISAEKSITKILLIQVNRKRAKGNFLQGVAVNMSLRTSPQTGVAIRNTFPRENGFPRHCAHWLGMTFFLT